MKVNHLKQCHTLSETSHLLQIVTVSVSLSVCTGVVTKPFGFEGRRRMQQALQAIENLRAVVDTLIIVSNDRYCKSYSTPLHVFRKIARTVSVFLGECLTMQRL